MDFAISLGFSGIVTGDVYALVAFAFVSTSTATGVFNCNLVQPVIAQNTLKSGGSICGRR